MAVRVRVRGWVFVLGLLLPACGGGGGGGSVSFELSGSSPPQGSTDAAIDAPVLLVFSRPTDSATISTSTITFEEEDGTPVPFEILVQGFNSASVNIAPLFDLKENVKHTIRLSGSIRSEDGASLKAKTICFVTRAVNPTIRPDQLIDLGDALHVPRYLPATVPLPDGRVVLIGGYRNATEATDTIEVYEPATRSFRLLDARLAEPRAEHSATLMLDGRIMVVGGVSSVDGPPLGSCEFLRMDAEEVSAAPALVEPRRAHAASQFHSGEAVMVSGGLDADGAEKDTIERFVAGRWSVLGDRLPAACVNGLQINYDFDEVYFSTSNLVGRGAFFDGQQIVDRFETDVRFRSTYLRVGSGQFLILGGDTRSAVTFDFGTRVTRGGTDFLFERRGAHSLTVRGLNGRRLLVAGGFNIAQLGAPALKTLEICDWLDPGPFGFPDVKFFRVENVELPVPFAGHAGFNEPGGPTVLAGGWADDGGDHSRRVVVILDNASSIDLACD